ncbi:MAG TPA: CpXC domain-containing protein [Herpetosiphonaceae bacterium]
MPISYAEHVPLTCPRCQTPFVSTTYIIVDGVERPDLVARILNDSLHDALCPNCGQTGRVPAPLLYHDGRQGRVLLGVPPDMSEAEWREVGQTLLWTLIGALPETHRLPYLGDVQAEAGLAGVAHVIRSEALAGSGGEEEREDLPPIVIAIQALLDAKGPAELQQILEQHPILNEPQAVAIMQELAAEAIKHGQVDAADGFARAAELLEQVKQIRAHAPTVSVAFDGEAAARITPEALEELAFAVLRSTTGQDLARTVDEHPELLEDWADDALATYARQARQEGKPRIADGLDERRAALREMREQYRAQQPVLDAIQAYLQAETGDEIEAVVLEHEALTGDAADRALARLAENTRAEGDEAFAAFVEERRRFLQQVRAALEEE